MKLKALFIITNENCHELIPKILYKANAPFHFIMNGSGVADTVMLDYLGLVKRKKIIAISLISEKDVMSVYKLLEHHISMSKAGNGIAFSMNIDAASAALSKAYALLAEKTEKTDDLNINDKVGELMENKIDHSDYELIITVAEKGSFNDIRVAAKNAGVRGGTLVHGLGMGSEKSEKFFGISVHPEKDIVIIIVKKEDSKTVMKKILEVAGLSTPHKGISFSLPVEDVFGLASKIEVDDLKLD